MNGNAQPVKHRQRRQTGKGQGGGDDQGGPPPQRYEQDAHHDARTDQQVADQRCQARLRVMGLVEPHIQFDADG